MDAKLQILKETFENEFCMHRFTRFTREFFNTIEVVNPDKKNINYLSEYAFYIASHTHVANYTDSERNRIAIFAVELKSGRSIERARSMQRNFISKLISNSGHEAAIVAFYIEGELRWRLSLVRLDYEFVAGRAKMNITPARRYSYLVGKDEPCHTAMEQLFPIFRNEQYNPTLDKIEEAFSIETVTKEFFDRYENKYSELKKYLDANRQFNAEAQLHQFTSEQFAKKLMGQLAFLYFLQKKGWLGVKVLPHTINEKQYKNAFYSSNRAAREIVPKAYHQAETDEYKLYSGALFQLSDTEADVLAGCFTPDPWGSGTKTFIRELYDACYKSKEKNFFDEYLEPLFYEALNRKRGANLYYKRFNCKIPFLNGGLFEPLKHYDWEYTKFEIPNELFSNRDIKGYRDADGILDIFDRYNFTMNEDEPLEREVAVDPEMLGKIFENLLDAKDRKSKGAFYTPREIVHYMCQESLTNYLVNETGTPYEDMKGFILYGELMKDEDCSKEVSQRRQERRIPESVYVKLGEIDRALENVKVADPAVGSGAFPLGMLSEIIRARENISAYYAAQIPITIDMHESQKKMQYSQRAQIHEMRHPYRLKWDAIKNSIFAVDIEASAVDIAKLRLWLSLVVDEDLEPSFVEKRLGDKQKDPHPLPNLDYNIMCGDSLMDEFEGVQLFDDSLLTKKQHATPAATGEWQTALFSDTVGRMTDDLFKEQDRFFGEEDTERKTAIKKKIDKIIDDIIRAKLTIDNNIEGLAKYNEILKQKTKPYFLWKLEFARIFKENGGFDIVIGNPPYGAKFTKKQKLFLSGKYPTVPDYESADFFIDKGRELLGKGAMLSYIVPNMFLSNVFAERYRKNLLDSWNFNRIDNLSSIDVFESAKVRNCIIFFIKDTCDFETIMTKASVKNSRIEALKIKSFTKDDLLMCIENWLNIIEQDEDQKGVLRKIKENSILLGDLSDVSQGLIPYDKYRGHSEETIKNRIWHANFQKDETYKRELGGKDVCRYVVKWNGNTWISYGEWLAAPRRQEFFTKERIIIREITNPRILAAYTTEEYYNTPSIINCINFNGVDIKYLLGILNSKLMAFFHVNNSPKANKGLFPKILVNDVRKLPIVIASEQKIITLKKLVDTMLDIKAAGSNVVAIDKVEKEIDFLVYEIYGLNTDEIIYVNDYLRQKGVH